MKHQKLKYIFEECKKNIGVISEEEKKLVLGFGSQDAKLMLIGEAPGAKEEEQGKPFVGQAGKNLTSFLEMVGLVREDLFITNVVKYRPYKISSKTGNKINRTPTTGEIKFFETYLYEEIEVISPGIIVTLGNTALKSILKGKETIGDVHGRLLNITIHNKSYRLFPLYHPASVIYRRELKEVYEEDLKKLALII